MFTRSVSWLICMFVATAYSQLNAVSGSNAGIRGNSLRSYIPEWSMMESIQKVKEIAGQDLHVIVGVEDSAIVVGDTHVVAHREVLAATPRYNTPETSSRQVSVPYEEDPVLRQLLDYLYSLRAPHLAPSITPSAHALIAQPERPLDAAAVGVHPLKDSPNDVRHAPVDLRDDHLGQVRTQPEGVVELSQLLVGRLAATSAPIASQTTTVFTTAQLHSNHSDHDQTPTTATPSTVICPSTPVDEDEVSILQLFTAEQMGQMLIEAARNGDVEELRNLLAAGADLGARAWYKRTALHWAAWNGHAVAARCLLDAGAVVGAKDQEDYRPMHMAALGGHPAVVRLLAAWGADINAQDIWGWTPLHLAVRERLPETAKALLDVGANRRLKNKSGLTPLDMAKNNENQEMIDALTQN